MLLMEKSFAVVVFYAVPGAAIATVNVPRLQSTRLKCSRSRGYTASLTRHELWTRRRRVAVVSPPFPCMKVDFVSF